MGPRETHIRVLNVLWEERLGGPQQRVLQVAQGLARHHVYTTVAIPKGEPTFASLLRDTAVPVHEFGLVRLRNTSRPSPHFRLLTNFWPNVRALRKLIRETAIDVVHTNGLMNTQAAIAARLERVALVWHLNDVNTPRPLRLAILPLLRAWADRIAVAARAVSEFYFPNTTKLDPRVRVLYAPVNTHRFKPGNEGAAVRAEMGIKQGHPVVGTVGNADPGRGWEHLLAAATSINKKFPRVIVLFIGARLDNRGSYWSYLHRRVGELGLQQQVIFAGRRLDVPCLLRAMTVYVHPSESEACPMAVLEASSTGLPVVATDVGGTRELVEDGTTGFLVRPRAPAEITDRVLRLLDSPVLAQEMGTIGMRRMQERFSLETCVDRHIQIYEEALNLVQ